jgi:hypothetical protein
MQAWLRRIFSGEPFSVVHEFVGNSTHSRNYQQFWLFASDCADLP